MSVINHSESQAAYTYTAHGKKLVYGKNRVNRIRYLKKISCNDGENKKNYNRGGDQYLIFIYYLFIIYIL